MTAARFRTSVALACTIAALVVVPSVHAGDGPSVRETDTRVLDIEQAAARLWPSGAGTPFRPTTLAEKRALRGLVERVTHGAVEGVEISDDWRERAERAGLLVERWQVAGVPVIALLEPSDDRRGAGAYLFRAQAALTESTRPVLLEAPHAYFDRGTGELALRLFVEAPPERAPRALFTNTLHRHHAASGEEGGTPAPTDLSHNPDHAFTVATLAFTKAVRRPEVLQIHGFARQRAGAKPRTWADVVVSAGVAERSPAYATAVAGRLTAALGDVVGHYPEEISILGATSNVQGRVVRQRRGGRFVHVELSERLRATLLENDETRAAFSRALFGDGSP